MASTESSSNLFVSRMVDDDDDDDESESADDAADSIRELSDPAVDVNHPSHKSLIDLDAILVVVGGWGRFQQVLFHGLCLPVVLATTLMFAVTVFATAVPKFRCRIPGCDDSPSKSNYSDAFVNNFAAFTIPPGTETAQCQQFKFRNQTSTEQCTPQQFDNTALSDCNEWIFDQSVYASTFAAEANIVCGDSWKGPMFESIFFFGVLVAALSSGLLSDAFGRRHVTMGCIFLLSVSSLGLIFSRDIVSFTFASFFLSIAQAGLFLVSFVLAMEMVGPKKRVFCGLVIELYFTMGELLVAGLAYWLRDWRTVVTVVTVPVFCFLLYWPVLPESTRWLLAKQRLDQAQKETNRISHWNGTQAVNIRNFRLKESGVRVDESAERESMLDLIKDRHLLFRLLNLCMAWLIITLGYYGLSLTSVSLSGDPYLNFFLSALVEIPGILLSWFGMEKIGRRLTMVISMMGAGVALLMVAVVDAIGKNDESFFHWFNLVSFLTGKSGMSSAFSVVYIYSSELFPTSVRTAAVGCCSTCGRIGAIVTPWISDQAKRSPWVVMLIFGGSAVVASLLNLLLPETLGRHLPETMAQARNLSVRASIPIDDADEEDDDVISVTRPLLDPDHY